MQPNIQHRMPAVHYDHFKPGKKLLLITTCDTNSPTVDLV